MTVAFTMTKLPFVLLLTIFLSYTHAQFTIQPDEFAMGNMDGLFDAIIDVRTQAEWDAGHVSAARAVWCCSHASP